MPATPIYPAKPARKPVRLSRFFLLPAVVAALGLAGCQNNGSGGPEMNKENIGTVLGGIGGAVLGAQFGKGRGTVDCCYPVKCISGHYGELVFGQKQKLDILLSPMIYNLPSFLSGHVAKTLTCPRVMAAPENIKAGVDSGRYYFTDVFVQEIHHRRATKKRSIKGFEA